jgi:hypothetical protein
MNRFEHVLLVIQFWVAFLQLVSGQGALISPISNALNPSFTVTALGTNIPYPLIFQYVYDTNFAQTTTHVDFPTTTAVFAFTPGQTQLIAVYCPSFDYNLVVAVSPTANGPNSAGFFVPPISLGQADVTATFLGNVLYPLTYTVSGPGGTITNGVLQAGESTVVFDAPLSFNRMGIYAANMENVQVNIAITPFVGIAVSPSPVRTGASVTVNVTATANADASITYQVFTGTTLISGTESPAEGTEWEFDAPGVSGVYTVSVINASGQATYGMAYTPLTVVTALVVVQPTPGTLLPAGATVSAVVSAYDPAADYTLTFGNGVFAYVTTVSDPIATVPGIPVPRNYIGQMYLTAVQGGFSDVATYTISVAQAVYRAHHLRRRVHVGR